MQAYRYKYWKQYLYSCKNICVTYLWGRDRVQMCQRQIKVFSFYVQICIITLKGTFQDDNFCIVFTLNKNAELGRSQKFELWPHIDKNLTMYPESAIKFFLASKFWPQACLSMRYQIGDYDQAGQIRRRQSNVSLINYPFCEYCLRILRMLNLVDIEIVKHQADKYKTQSREIRSNWTSEKWGTKLFSLPSWSSSCAWPSLPLGWTPTTPRSWTAPTQCLRTTSSQPTPALRRASPPMCTLTSTWRASQGWTWRNRRSRLTWCWVSPGMNPGSKTSRTTPTLSPSR